MPESLDAVVLRALSRDLAERYDSVAALDAALAALQLPLLDAVLDGGLLRAGAPELASTRRHATADAVTRPVRP